MTTMTGGDAIAESLVANGVDTVFGIPGIQLDNLFDAFHRRRNRLRVIHTRHEQGAAYMAMGYAQSSDRTGTFVVVPGPGLLNSRRRYPMPPRPIFPSWASPARFPRPRSAAAWAWCTS